ncbi:MAG TPA: hypothetical protein DEQ02_01845, partial [Ruminococcaceae bacterium]|nr:hypothetical protein [Oscillospiraceae bacterium]
KIIFLGYSFPDADIYIKYLLKRIESNRDTPPEIVVCNYVKNKNKLYADNEQLRYNRFFKGKVSYKKGSGFDDFCKTPKSYI